MTSPVEQLPPAVQAPSSLPLAVSQLTWQQFERFCRALVTELPGTRRVVRYGGSGSRQKGVDIIAYMLDGEEHVFQCKQVAKFTPSDATRAVRACTYDSTRKFLLLSVIASSQTRDVIESESDWELWDIEDISERVRRLPEPVAQSLVATNFGPSWVAAFLPAYAQASAGTTTAQADLPELPRSQIDYRDQFARHGELVARDSLLHEIETQLCSDNSGPKVLLLLGPAGHGKSALANALVLRSCNQGGNVAFHLAGGHFHDEQVVARSLVHQLARLSPSAAEAAADCLHSDGISALRQTYGVSPGVLLLIDGLDEFASSRAASGLLVNYLLHALPSHARVLVASRPLHPHTELLAASRHSITIDLTERVLETREALSAYVRGAQEELGFDSTYLERVIRFAGENFLHAVTQTKIWRSERAANTPLSPPGESLREIVGLETARLRQLVDDADISDEMWMQLERFRLYLALTRSPLTLAMLGRLTDLTGSRRRRALSLFLRQYSPALQVVSTESSNGITEEVREAYIPAHQTIREIFAKTHQDGATWDRFTDREIRDAHGVFVKQLGDWRSSDADVRGYAVSHVIAHCIGAGMVKMAADLLTTPGFIDSKCDAGMTQGLLDDYRAILSVDSGVLEATQRDWIATIHAALDAELPNIQSRDRRDTGSGSSSFPSQQIRNRIIARSTGTVESALSLLPLTKEPELLLMHRVPNAAMASKRRFGAERGPITHVAVSPDGARVLSVTHESALHLWDPRTGELLGEVLSRSLQITSIEFIDARTAVAASKTGELWQLKLEAPPYSHNLLARHSPGIQTIAVSRSRRRVAYGGGCLGAGFSESGGKITIRDAKDPVIVLYDMQGGPQSELRGHSAPLLCLAFSSDGEYLVSSSYDGSVRLWDIGGRTSTSTVVYEATAYSSDEICISVAFSDRDKAVLCCTCKSVLIIPIDDASERRELTLWNENDYMGDLTEFDGFDVSPNGALVAITESLAGLRVFCLSDGELVARHLEILGYASPCFSMDGSMIIAGSHEGDVLVYDVPTSLTAKPPKSDFWPIEDIAIAPDGTQLLSAHGGGVARLWQNDPNDLVDNELPTNPGIWGEHMVQAEFAGDSKTAASVGEHGMFNLWDLQSRPPTLVGTGGVTTLAISEFSPDGRLLNCGPEDERVRKQDPKRREYHLLEVACEDGPKLAGESVPSLLFTPDGRFLIRIDHDVLVLWPVEGGRGCDRRVSIERGAEGVVTVSPDMCAVVVRLATGLRIVDMETGETLAEVAIERQECSSVRFSPDAYYIVTGGRTGLVRLIGAASGAGIVHANVLSEIEDLRFSPDGSHLWVADRGGAIGRPSFFGFRMCNLATGAPIVIGWKQDGRLFVQCPSCRSSAIDAPGSWSAAGWPHFVASISLQSLGTEETCHRCRSVYHVSERTMSKPPKWHTT